MNFTDRVRQWVADVNAETDTEASEAEAEGVDERYEKPSERLIEGDEFLVGVER